jgi:hypothetical protein
MPNKKLGVTAKLYPAPKELTVKALFATLPYSDMGLRYHFRKLVDTGWIELHAVNGDARVKQVKPTEKLSKQFGLLTANLSPLLNKFK